MHDGAELKVGEYTEAELRVAAAVMQCRSYDPFLIDGLRKTIIEAVRDLIDERIATAKGTGAK